MCSVELCRSGLAVSLARDDAAPFCRQGNSRLTEASSIEWSASEIRQLDPAPAAARAPIDRGASQLDRPGLHMRTRYFSAGCWRSTPASRGAIGRLIMRWLGSRFRDGWERWAKMSGEARSREPRGRRHPPTPRAGGRLDYCEYICVMQRWILLLLVYRVLYMSANRSFLALRIYLGNPSPSPLLSCCVYLGNHSFRLLLFSCHIPRSNRHRFPLCWRLCLVFGE